MVKTTLVVIAAFAAGWLVWGHIMAGRSAPPDIPQPVGLRAGRALADALPGPWKKPGRYYAPPGGRERVKLRHRFAGTGQALRWAEEAFGGTRVIAYCHDVRWLAVLVDKGLPYNAWDALFFTNSFRGRSKCTLEWISYGCVTISDPGDWPDCAYLEKDDRTLVFQTRALRKLSVTTLPSKVAYP